MTAKGINRTQSGRKSWQRGHLAEFCAALWLSLKGYRILERRWSCSAGEIDIIAQRRHTTIFVEVKYRSGDSSTAISVRQQQRLCRAAHIYLTTQMYLTPQAPSPVQSLKTAKSFKQHTARNNSKLHARMDAFLIDRFIKFRHIENAWHCNL